MLLIRPPSTPQHAPGDITRRHTGEKSDDPRELVRVTVTRRRYRRHRLLHDLLDRFPLTFSGFGINSSTRRVLILPGTTTLTVTPSAATSAATVFDHPTSDARNVFEMPRLGIGCTTPEEVLVTMRPHPRRRMPGSNALLTRITLTTIDSKYLRSASASISPADPVEVHP